MNIRNFANKLLASFQELEVDGQRFAGQIAKSHNYQSEQYNPHRKNLIDQYMWNHIQTGCEAFVSLIEHLQGQGLEFDDQEMQLALAGFVLHDLHKNQSLKEGAKSEYDLGLTDLEEIGEKLCANLGLSHPPAEFLRAAGVSSYSNKHGDKGKLSDQFRWTCILDWVKLMDKVASINSIAECKEGSLTGLEKLLRQVLPPAFSELEVHYHWIQEIRGVLTTQLHKAIAVMMHERSFYPWLFFGDGTLYLSLKQNDKVSLQEVSGRVNQLLHESLRETADELPVEEMFARDTLECDTLAFMVYDRPQDFAQLFYELFAGKGKSKTFPEDKFKAKDLKKYRVKTHQDLWNFMGINGPLDEDLREKWFFAARFFGAMQRLIQKAEPSLTLPMALKKMGEHFGLAFQDLLTLEPVLKGGNRRFDGNIWLAYRFIKAFTLDEKPADQVPIEAFRIQVRRQAARFLEDYITPEKIRKIVSRRLGLEKEIEAYMTEQVVLSWEKKRILRLLDEKEIYKKKSRSQSRLCNICNRSILPKVDAKVKEKIIKDNIQVFSNRILPKHTGVSALHWCGVCAYEFILRKASGIFNQGDHKKSQQIYLFAVPSYQFTSEVMLELQEKLENYFGTIHVHPGKLINHAWQTPFVEPTTDNLRNHIKKHFEIYSEYFQQNREAINTGDLLSAGPVGNFILFTFQSYSSSQERTREEAWIKALSAALSLHYLYGFRIYLTEKPFLMLSDLRELRYAVQLDAPPGKIAGLLQPADVRKTTDYVVPIEHVKTMMERLACIWEIHRFVHPFDSRKRTDKQVSDILNKRETNPVCGAYFFKRYMTRSEKFHAVQSFQFACQKINQEQGDGIMSLVREITKASLTLYRPFNTLDGRAYRFENLYRTIVKGIKEGRDKSEIAGSVIKRLERLVSQKGGRVVTLPIDPEAVTHLVDLVYDRFFLDICKGNLSILSQRQNALADGVYFETYLELQKSKINE